MVHTPHLRHGQHAQNQRVEELHEAPAVALLHGIQIVGKQAHQVADLVDLVVFPAQVLGMAEHLVPQIGLHLDGRAEDGHPPQEAAEHDGHRHDEHGLADAIQQKRHVKSVLHTIHHHIALVHAVDDHLVDLGDHQL